jgi:predicted Zn-dependent peptidase
MRKYFKEFYVGQNTVLVIAGNYPDDYIKQVTTYLNRLPKGERNQRILDLKFKNSVKLITKQTEQAHFGICLPSYSITDKDKNVAEIVATALGGYMSARLFTEIREKRGWAYRVAAYNDPSQDVGYLGIFGGIKKDKITEAIALTKKEIIKFRDGFTDEEIKRAKSHLLGASTLTFDDPEERAKFTVLQYLLNEKPETPEEINKAIQAVTKPEIKRVAKQILTGDNLSLTVIGPYKNKDKFVKILTQTK